LLENFNFIFATTHRMDNSPKFNIPFYQEINDFLSSINSDFRTENPYFFCLPLHANSSTDAYKTAFKKGFYYIGLVTNAGTTKITYDATNVTNLNSFLVFQAPNLLYSFLRDSKANGYLIYFKKDLFSFFKPNFDDEFPMFDLLHTNFFKLNHQKFAEFAPLFQDVFLAYNQANDKHRIASIKLLALLYQLKEYTKAFNQIEESFKTPHHILLQKFLQLVNNFYLEKRTVDEYADLLAVTANYLSKSVKLASGKNALLFINERLITEAKSMIQYSGLDIAEIAYQLGFTDNSNFGKFFKKYVGISPLEFRRNSVEK
jgi:AraC family transcriptional regulator, transcriptional activator of pobA